MPKFGKPMDFAALGRTVAWRAEIADDQRRLAKQLRATTVPVSACPICGSADSEPYTTVFEYRYRGCSGCKHIFCADLPSDEASKALYSESSDGKSVQGKIYLDADKFQIRVDAIATPKVQFVGEVINSRQPAVAKRWVDVGSGAGEILFACKEHGWEASGIESDPEEAGFARLRGLAVVNDYLTSANASELLKGASVVSAFNVLEHLHDPVAFLSLLRRANPDAFTVFEVPRHPSISSFLNQCFPAQAYRHIYPPDHLHIFTEKSIEILLERSGYRKVDAWHFGQDFAEMVMSCASVSPRESTFLGEILRLSNSVQPLIDQAGLSDTVIMIVEPSK